MRKKIFAAVISLLMLTACGNKNTETETEEKVYEEITSEVTEENLLEETKQTEMTDSEDKADAEKAEQTAETEVTTAETEVPTETTTVSETTEKKTEPVKEGDFVYKIPDRAFIEKCVKEAVGGKIYIAMYADGSCEKVTEDTLYAIEMASYAEELLSEETYNALSDEEKKWYGVTNYEEYKAFVMEMFGIGETSAQTRPAVYFCFDGEVWFDEEALEGQEIPENTALSMKAADFLFAKPAENREIVKAMSDALKEGRNYFASCSAEYMGNNVLRCDAGFGSDSDSYEADFEYDEKISANDKEGIVLGDSFVPFDTEVLFISSRDAFIAEMLASDFIPDDCVKAATPENSDRYSEEEDAVYDIALIAEKLPNLKKLYMYQAKLVNEDKLPLLTKLESLSYYSMKVDEKGFIDAGTETPFTGMKNLKELRLYGDYESYEFLADMPKLEDVFINASNPSAEKLEQIFSCPYITGLELKNVSSLKGIEKLENLTSINIDSNNITDFSPLGEVKNLETVDIMSNGKANGLDSLSKLKKVKDLTLHSMDETDLFFLEKMTSLERLSLCYVNNSFDDSIGTLKNLKDLSLLDISRSYDTAFLSELDNLERLHMFGNTVNADNLPKAKKLNDVFISLCWFSDLSGLKDCKSLKTLTIYNCNSSFDGKWLENSGIEGLSLSCAEIENFDSFKTLKNLKQLTTFKSFSAENIKELEKALPDCVIEEVE